jgi:hypothetical protein
MFQFGIFHAHSYGDKIPMERCVELAEQMPYFDAAHADYHPNQ